MKTTKAIEMTTLTKVNTDDNSDKGRENLALAFLSKTFLIHFLEMLQLTKWLLDGVFSYLKKFRYIFEGHGILYVGIFFGHF
jgi:hypothetical protein